MLNTSIIEINKNALEQNIQFLRNVLGEGIRISSVVKGNAYGHGIEVFVPLAEECGIDHFSVFSAQEAAIAANVCKDTTTIMIMGMIDNEDIEWAILNNIEFFVFETDRLLAAIKTSKKLGKRAKIHLEIETGMNRTGFSGKELSRILRLLKNNKEHYVFQGLCTHYAGAESIANYLRVQNQIKRYNKLYKWFIKHNLHPNIKHTACSAAAMTYPKTRMDLVRIGIMQYGFWPSIETKIDYLSDKYNKEDPLRRVIRWRSKVMSVKTVKAGEFIGYGTNFIAREEMKIAIVPVGYSHGYSRALSHQGRVLINGHRLDVIGIVNMNLLIINTSQVPETKKGDEVVLVGKQGDSEITIASFSEFSNQLNYELLSRLPLDIPRIVTNEEKKLED